MTIGDEKKRLRRWIREQRARLDPAWIAERSAQAARRVRELPEFAAARTLGLYLSMPGEVETDAILAVARDAGKRILVPAFREETGEYDLARFDAGTPLRPGPCSVREPADPEWISREEPVDAILVPGLAFDLTGGRLGHGKGHYDRLLRRDRMGFKIGLTFEFQMVGRLPATEQDVGMDGIITEERTIRTGFEAPDGQAFEAGNAPDRAMKPEEKKTCGYTSS